MGHGDMESDIRKLLNLLKKILKNHPHGSEDVAKFLDQKSFNLNLCFLTFIPMTPEELMEFEEMYDDYLNQAENVIPRKDEAKTDPRLEFRLTNDDLDFLKKHGMKF